MDKEKLLEAIEQAMDDYHEAAEKESRPGYFSGVVDGLNKVYRFVASKGEQGMID